MKMHKMTVYVVDFEDFGVETICTDIQDCNDYALIKCYDEETTDIGEWSDDHPVNKTDAPKELMDSYFEVVPSFKDLIQVQFDTARRPCKVVVAIEDEDGVSMKFYAVDDVDVFVDNMNTDFVYLHPSYKGSTIPVLKRRVESD